jgi:secreted trypsin-like serine protease
MRKPILVLTMALVALLLAAAPAGAITGGQPDGGAHPYVGMVYNDQHLCSGTLIAPTVFLTAAHCAAAFAQDNSQIYVTFAAEANLTSNRIRATEVHVHPSFCNPCGSGLPGFDAHDVAVVILARAPKVGTAGLPGAGYVDDLGNGADLTVVGYGVRGFNRGGGPPQPAGFATRYEATVKIITLQGSVGDMFIKESASKGGTCFGDSGGPSLDGATVVAVTSFGTNGLCAGTGYAQRIDRQDILDWLSTYVG